MFRLPGFKNYLRGFGLQSSAVSTTTFASFTAGHVACGLQSGLLQGATQGWECRLPAHAGGVDEKVRHGDQHHPHALRDPEDQESAELVLHTILSDDLGV